MQVNNKQYKCITSQWIMIMSNVYELSELCKCLISRPAILTYTCLKPFDTMYHKLTVLQICFNSLNKF